MILVLTSLSVVASGYAFFKCALLLDLFPSFQSIIVALSIMAAAILVRLNRGMPTLEWKSLLPLERIRLTAAIRDLTREYLIIIATNATLLITLIFLTAVGPRRIEAHAGLATQLFSGWIGGLLALCVARMAYVVWRDYDIVRLQKALIDASADRDLKELETKLAEEKLSAIKSAALKASSQSKAARDWPEPDPGEKTPS